MRKWPFAVSLLIAVSLLTACGTTSTQPSSQTRSTVSPPKEPISVFYAGSMTKVMEQRIGPGFDESDEATFQGRGAGSSQLAQMIHSGLGNPDVFISASPTVNNRLLMGSVNHDLVQWYMTLARDQIVIAYSPSSRFKSQLESAAHGQIPWYKVLMEKGFRLGRTDPKLDPKGVSTLYLFQLASKYYHVPDLEKEILGPIENSNQVFPEESLLAQLTSGQVDAVIAYKHEAVEWGVPYIALPKEVNLGDPSLASLYATATYPTTDGKTLHGSPILFTITIPSTVTHKSEAEKFVKYMIIGQGHQALMKDGFAPIPALLAGSKKDVPAPLQSLVQGTYTP